MHKTFYASGFLYHLPSQQILLQQQNCTTSLVFPWSLFEKEYKKEGQQEIVFKKAVTGLLRTKIETVYPIYVYFDDVSKKNNSLMYATVKNLQQFSPKNNCVFRWFSFKDVLKLNSTDQTKHDIVVGQRVIEASERKRLGLHTF